MGLAQSTQKKVVLRNSQRRRTFHQNLTQDLPSTDLEMSYQVHYNDILGQGHIGKVCRVVKKSSSKAFAMKSVLGDKVGKNGIAEVNNEIQMLEALDHPNIIRIKETYRDNGNIYLIMELCSGGALNDRKCVSEDQARNVILQLCSALEHCHQIDVCHRDVKLENILYVDHCDDSEVKLIDFGLARNYCTNILRQPVEKTVGTLYALAPEALQGQYSFASDAWSVGIVAYYILSQRKPFRGNDQNMLVDRIRSVDYQFDAPIWEFISDEAKEFINNLLLRNPLERWTMRQCLQSRWLKMKDAPPPSLQVRTETIGNIRNFQNCNHLRRTLSIALVHSIPLSTVAQDDFRIMDTQKDGRITFEQFQTVMAQSGVPDSESWTMFKDLCPQYTSSDTIATPLASRRNTISYSSFLAATSNLHSILNQNHLLELFQRMDKHNKGYITPSEFQSILGKNKDWSKSLSDTDRLTSHSFLKLIQS